jgi:hypothetical protein
VIREPRTGRVAERPGDQQSSLPKVQDCYVHANSCLDMWNNSGDHTARSWLLRMAGAWMRLAFELVSMAKAEHPSLTAVTDPAPVPVCPDRTLPALGFGSWDSTTPTLPVLSRNCHVDSAHLHRRPHHAERKPRADSKLAVDAMSRPTTDLDDPTSAAS